MFRTEARIVGDKIVRITSCNLLETQRQDADVKQYKMIKVVDLSKLSDN